MFSFSDSASVWFRRAGVFVGLVLVACVLMLPSLSSDAKGEEDDPDATGTVITVTDTTDSTTTTKTTKTTGGGSSPLSNEVSTVNPSGGEGFQTPEGDDSNSETGETEGELDDCSWYLDYYTYTSSRLTQYLSALEKMGYEVELIASGSMDLRITLRSKLALGVYNWSKLQRSIDARTDAYDMYLDCLESNSQGVEAEGRER